MPAMSTIEQLWCRSLPWRLFTSRLVFPWALGKRALRGDVLEIGSGSGAMAAALLDAYPGVTLTATDVDPAMLESARVRLAQFGERARVEQADATRLPFPDAQFDAVVSLIMLHHVIEWEAALAEVARVLRPGGLLVGYDLVESGAARFVHRLDRSRNRMATTPALRARLAELPFDDIEVRPSIAGRVARFAARRSTDTTTTTATTTTTTTRTDR